MKNLKFLATAGASLALLQSQAALAQSVATPCVKQADLADAVVYSMPSMIGAFQAKCGPALAASGFMRTKGPQLAASYTARQPAAWPGARRFLLNFIQGDPKAKANGMADMLAGLPSDAVRPIVDALIQQEVSKEIPLENCGNIERGISLLAPLPPENMGGLTVFLFQIAKVKKLNLCGAK